MFIICISLQSPIAYGPQSGTSHYIVVQFPVRLCPVEQDMRIPDLPKGVAALALLKNILGAQHNVERGVVGDSGGPLAQLPRCSSGRPEISRSKPQMPACERSRGVLCHQNT